MDDIQGQQAAVPTAEVNSRAVYPDPIFFNRLRCLLPTLAFRSFPLHFTLKFLYHSLFLRHFICNSVIRNGLPFYMHEPIELFSQFL